MIAFRVGPFSQRASIFLPYLCCCKFSCVANFVRTAVFVMSDDITESGHRYRTKLYGLLDCACIRSRPHPDITSASDLRARCEGRTLGHNNRQPSAKIVHDIEGEALKTRL